MKLKSIISFTVVLAFLFLSANVHAAKQEKLGFLDLSRTFDEYAKTKDYDKVLEQETKAYETERDKLISEIKEIQDKLALLNEKEKEKKERELEAKTQDFRQFDQKRQMDLRKNRDEKLQEILKDIEKTVKEIAEKEGYTLIFNDRVLVYSDKTIDITEATINLLNQRYKSNK